MLSKSQIESYRTNGYLVVGDVLHQARILDPVRREYAALLDRLYCDWVAQGQIAAPPDDLDFEARLIRAYSQGCDWFQAMDISLPGDRVHADTPFHIGPAVFDMVTDPRLLDLVEDLIGPEITSNPIQHVRIKPPATNLRRDEIRAHVTGTDWHQDRAVALEDADQTDMVTIWLAVTDATPENGCLQVVPRKHDQMLPHCPKVQTAIADGFLDIGHAIPLPVRSGGVVVLDPLLPHASLVNGSSGIRWSFDLRYNRTGQPTGRAHFPEFIARSRNDPQSELGDWQVWRQMWETARDRVSQQPHIDIHRWKSDAPTCA